MFIQLRSIEHVRKEQLRSIEHVRKESECHCTPPHPTPPHPTKPLRAFAENKNWRGVQAKMLYVENLTGSPVTPPPENRPSQKETSIATIHFQVRKC